MVVIKFPDTDIQDEAVGFLLLRHAPGVII